MRIVKFSVSHPVTVGMFTIALVLFGVIALRNLPIELLPEISYPALTIRTEYPGNAPIEVENLITRPIEEAVGVVGNVVQVSSVSKAGVSEVTIEFDWGTNMDFAVLDVREKLDLLNLPDDASKPVILRFDPSQDPIVRYVLYGEEDLRELRTIADEFVKRELEAVDGVAAVKVEGGLEEEIHIDIDEEKLSRLGISINSLVTRLTEENINLAGGKLREGDAQYLVRTVNEFENVDDIKEIVIGMRGKAPIYLRDVANVVSSHKERDIIIRVNGTEGVEVACYKEADRNTVAVSGDLNKRVLAVSKELPVSVKMVKVFDQAEFISRSMEEVVRSAIYGGILAVLILYLFLQHSASTAIISLAIPVSIVATFFLMYTGGVTINIMSLGGLALGVGLLVDNSIVVLESINRHRSLGADKVTAAIKGTTEVGNAVVAATLTTVAVFLPIIFVRGVAGQLFRDQALTVTFSLLTSLLVALTLIPMFFSRGAGVENRGDGSGEESVSVKIVGSFFRVLLLPVKGVRAFISAVIAPFLKVFSIVYSRLESFYAGVLDGALRRRTLTLLVAMLSVLAAIFMYKSLGKELIPELVQGQFNIEVKLPAGTPLERTSQVMFQMEKEIIELDGIKRVMATVGSNPAMGETLEEKDESRGQINVVLDFGSDPEREEKIKNILRARFSRIPELEFKFSRPSYFSLRTPVEVVIWGEDLEKLKEISKRAKALIGSIEGITDIRSLIEEGTPEIVIHFDRDKLATYGLTIGQISRLLKTKVYGDVATELVKGERKIDIRVQLRRDRIKTLADLENLIVNPSQAVPVKLKSVADFRVLSSPSEIHRLDQQRVARITANLSGKDLGSAVREIKQLLDSELSLDPGYGFEIGGQNREMLLSFSSMRFALILAIFLVYLVMASQFESFVHPFVILFTIPLSLVGAIIFLFITHKPVNVLVFIGVIMLAGIVVNNAIVLVDYINTLRRGGMRKIDAIRQGASVRLRPILMTTSTTVLGLVPMALGFGEGGELRSPMAITVIGGLIFSTLLTLVVIPVVYSIFERAKE